MTRLTITHCDVVRLPSRAAATLALLLLLPAAAAGQSFDRSMADTLSVPLILEIAARDSIPQRRTEAVTVIADLIRADSVGTQRTDSLVRGLREMVVGGFDADRQIAVLIALVGTGDRHGQHARLGEVMDSARNVRTRVTLLRMSKELPDSARRDVLLRGLQLNGSPAASYVANLAAALALQWDPHGRPLLWDAQMRGLIKDERAARLVRSALGSTPDPAPR